MKATDESIAQQQIEKIKSALAAVEGAIERGENPGRIHIALTDLLKLTSIAYTLYRDAIGWHSRSDLFDKLRNPRWDYIENDPLDVEAVIAYVCSICGGDRRCETISYWPRGEPFTGVRKHQAIATCNSCSHAEMI